MEGRGSAGAEHPRCDLHEAALLASNKVYGQGSFAGKAISSEHTENTHGLELAERRPF